MATAQSISFAYFALNSQLELNTSLVDSTFTALGHDEFILDVVLYKCQITESTEQVPNVTNHDVGQCL